MPKTTDKITALLKAAKAGENFFKNTWYIPKKDHELTLSVIVEALGMSTAAIKQNVEKLEAEHLVVTSRHRPSRHRPRRWRRHTAIRLATPEEVKAAKTVEATRDAAKTLREAVNLPVYADSKNPGRFTVKVLGDRFRNQTENQIRSLSCLRMDVERQLNDITGSFTCPDCDETYPLAERQGSGRCPDCHEML
jgi:hypothetical protein